MYEYSSSLLNVHDSKYSIQRYFWHQAAGEGEFGTIAPQAKNAAGRDVGSRLVGVKGPEGMEIHLRETDEPRSAKTRGLWNPRWPRSSLSSANRARPDSLQNTRPSLAISPSRADSRGS